jgi:hypothetical protein
MTAHTRRRLALCAVLAALLLPVESVLVAALATPSPTEAATEWTASLSPAERAQAAQQISDYPYTYRRAIMSALTPNERAQVWRTHLNNFQATRALDTAQSRLIAKAVSSIAPELFDGTADPAQLAELNAIYDVAVSALGRTTAAELFIRLGPDGPELPRRRNPLPLAQRLADTVRNWATAYAAPSKDGGDCDCSTSAQGFCDAFDVRPVLYCSDANGCTPDNDWPMCGPLWAMTCNGGCKWIGIEGF